MEIEQCVASFLEKVTPVSEIERVHITDACNRVAAKTVYVDAPVPAYPKSAMDGYAVCASDIENASKENPVVLKVLGENCAGDCNELPYMPNSAVRVMTGAYIPEGFDAVVRQEDTDYGMEHVAVYAPVKPYANYCKIGEDMKAGETVLEKDSLITPLHIGLLAGTGAEAVDVYRQLRVALVSTGSELTPIGTALEKGKIYNSILYMLKAAVERAGLLVSYETVCADEESALERILTEAADCADIVVTTGGVSVGKKDLLPAALERVGAQRLFARANIQPGTPTIGSVWNKTPVLSLSGNPYAAIVNFEIYFWELAAVMTHNNSLKPVIGTAVLKSDYPKKNKLRRFVRAYEENGEVFLPTQTHASSVISNMTQCNCYLDIAAGTMLSAGDM
ncbi:MAG: molybdopterin molybdotransferase MoeA, partial [Lachnospiraceae bacterium]|nr:molybdopterin molybdotransferase MoeA [Lachnospiraceae bacterium]